MALDRTSCVANYARTSFRQVPDIITRPLKEIPEQIVAKSFLNHLHRESNCKSEENEVFGDKLHRCIVTSSCASLLSMFLGLWTVHTQFRCSPFKFTSGSSGLLTMPALHDLSNWGEEEAVPDQLML